VFEPFGGSGTTLIAAERSNRTAYVIEMCPKYCDRIIQRWETLTGNKARRESGRDSVRDGGNHERIRPAGPF
jgi:DNA modification methylase